MKRAQRDAYCGVRETWYQRILNLLAPLLVLASIVYLAVVWRSIPATIPTHYNALGAATGYGPKQAFWIIPVLALFTDGIFALMWRFPQLWSTGVAVTPQNRAYLYLVLRDMLAEVRLEMALLFVPVIFLSNSANFSGSYVWVGLSLSALTMLRVCIRLFRAKRIG